MRIHFSKEKIKKFSVVFFAVSYIFLFIWAFQDARILLKYAAIKMAGYAISSPSFSEEDIFLSRYEPESEMIPAAEHLLTEPSFPTVEFHGHIFRDFDREAFFQNLKKSHAEYFIDLALQTSTKDDYLKLLEKTGNDKRIIIFPGLNWKKAENDDFRGMADDLEEIVKAGNIKGIKLWKDFGLKDKKKNGELIHLDDPALDPVWDICEKYNLLVAIHTADPPAFFKKADRYNERFSELNRHTDWSFTGEDLPSFQELLDQRDRLFKRRSRVRFIALHFGELAHDLKQAAKMLDTNPNVWIDTAQRIDELGRQPAASRIFFLKYQDRILYGTDGLPDYEKARIYWRFLETGDEYFDYYPPHKPKKGIWKIYGLGLPESILRKIYYENSFKLLGLR